MRKTPASLHIFTITLGNGLIVTHCSETGSDHIVYAQLESWWSCSSVNLRLTFMPPHHRSQHTFELAKSWTELSDNCTLNWERDGTVIRHVCALFVCVNVRMKLKNTLI